MDIEVHLAGHAGENFSVEREEAILIREKKINKNFFVLLTDNPNRKFAKNIKVINNSYCYREPMAKELYNWLLEQGLSDFGAKKSPSKALINVYIIDKG